ncbi:MAG: hypothetical protein QOH03_962 [Kribbellaceae bacterium]|nr:hypothetical protein [Kribbellaceae bacterium]
MIAALTAVDACALLDPAKAEAPGFTATSSVRRTAPHACLVDNGKGESVQLRLAVPSDRYTRFDHPSMLIEGVKVYQDKHDDLCELELPVSFDQAINFSSHRTATSPKALCQQADAFVRAAIPALGKASRPVTAPLAGWSGCRLLSAIRGRPITSFAIDGTIDGCREVTGDEQTASVSTSYAGALRLMDFERMTTVDGRPAGLDTREVTGPPGITIPDGTCRLSWNGPTAPTSNWVRFVVSAPTCPQATQLATRLSTVIRGAIPKGASPQLPITFAKGEPDSDQPGACADLAAFWPASETRKRCLPYVPATAPRGAAAILNAAKADGNVLCAISEQAVRERFGAGFRPVTIGGRRCQYVEPSHGLEIGVVVDDQEIQQIPGVEAVVIADRPGWHHTLDMSATRRASALHVEAAKGVWLRVYFDFRVPAGGSKLNTDREKDQQSFTADLLALYF